MGLYACSDCGTGRSDQVGSTCPNCGNVLKQKIKRGPKPQFAGYSGLASLMFIRAFKYGWIGCLLALLVLVGCIAVVDNDRNDFAKLIVAIIPVVIIVWFVSFMLWAMCRNKRTDQDRAYDDAVEYWETGDVRPGDSPPSASGNTRRVFGVVRNVDSDSSGGGGDFSGMG
jgi:hypothetical protein